MRTFLLILALGATASLFAQTQSTYYSDGKMKETRWVEDGRLEFAKYHENGELAERGAFVNGKSDGVWKQFDPHGRLITKARFVNGLLQGRCLLSSHDGSQQFHLRYAEGRLVHGIETNASGEMVAERGQP